MMTVRRTLSALIVVLCATVASAQSVTVLASSARTASGTSVITGIANLEQLAAAELLLTVSAAGSAADDTLDVYVQRSLDAGTTYDDFIHFTQVLGNGGAKKFLAQWRGVGVTPESELHVPADGSLAAGVLQGGPPAATWRIKWTIVTGSGTHSFTFKIDAAAQRVR